MHQDGANPRYFGSLHGSQYRIAQQRGSDSFPLTIFMNSEPAKYHHRHWIWHVALNLTGGAGVSNGAYCQRVVADDSSPSGNHIGARCPALLVLERPAPKPVIQRGLAAFKIGNAVLAGEPLRWPEWRLWAHFSHGA